MHSGNIGLSQNLETLVDAAAELRDIPDLAVVVVGEGVKKEALIARAHAHGLTNVRFLPFTPKARLHESFATADLFVVSLQRGLAGYIVPSKLYGILAAGRPYVAAVEADCEVASLTTRLDCGVLAEPGDARSLAAEIRTLYHDRERLERCGEHAREASLAFDRRAQVARYAALFREVAPGPARKGGVPVPERT
jgi:colanic acid biosynthesis glycosyl transferase WcaI